MDDAECIGCLEPDERAPPERVKRSLVHTMGFPAQETKIGAGADVVDPATGKGPGEIVSVDPAEGVLRLKRRATRTEPLPQAIIPAGPRSSAVLSDALRRLGRAVAADGTRGPGPYRAARDLLLQERPRVRGIAPGEPLASDADDPVERAVQLVRDLDESALFVQGPPGSGKTYTAARVICAMIAEGKRVGVAANAHKAIHRLLLEVEEAAREAGLSFRGVKKSADGADSVFKGHFVESIGDAGTIASRLGEFDLLAGTAWLFAREDLDQALDVLFVDEAGQVSLANALAMAMAARNLVLVGDPQQLAQPTKGFHPEGAGVSVLEHLLGDAATIPADRGLFLARTWRMHPDVCAFISDLMYEGRLRARPENARQAVAGDGALGGTGLRFLPVAHDGNVQRSQEEAERIAPEVGALVGREWTDKDGNSHELGLSDVLVVTPYNAQVHCLREALPPGSSVGTVDKFQGQQAPAVFFSMATSSGEELPRTLEFLFSRNRLNVAVSRARCLSILVASPRLLHVRCRTVEQMRMVNALCRFVEMAT